MNEEPTTIDELLDEAFDMPDFRSTWFFVDNWYKRLGFKDPIPDSDRIEEYKWITEQLRKVIFKIEDEMRELASKPEMLLQYLDNKIAKANDKATSRKELVFGFMRDEWYITTRNEIENLLSQ